MCAAAFTVSLAVICIAGVYHTSVHYINSDLTTVTATRYGLGKHIWLIPMGSVFETMKGCILVRAVIISQV